MKQTVYIHIGSGKTGTSAIQAFLNFNREKLAKDYSCLYPNFNSLFFKKGQSQHNHCHSFTMKDSSAIHNSLKSLINYSSKKGIAKIVISCEGYLAKPEIGVRMHHTLNQFNAVNCRIIAYLRRQDHWYESAWKQWGIKMKEYTNIKEFYQGKRIIWLDNLHQWSELFGKENIIIHPYEKMQLPDGLIPDFLRIIDIDYSADDWVEPPKTNRNENIGFSRDVVEILRLNRGMIINRHDNRLFDFFSEYLGDESKKAPYQSYSFLNPKQRLEILQMYEDMNRTIAREFLGRSDGKLFYEPWPDPDEPWEPCELTVEKIVPIFTQILFNMDIQYKKQLIKR